jgi:PAS domain S-box-containing protein
MAAPAPGWFQLFVAHRFMSWVIVIWSMAASACLTLAGVHLLVWCMKRKAWASLLFSLTATATAVLAGCELWMARAETPEEFGTAVRWLHVPTWVLILALVGFVRLYLRAGRPWLGWTVCVLRTFSLLLNFQVGQNLNYREVTGLRHIPFLGGSVSVGEGVPNPWMLVGQLSLLLFVIFVADAAITVWRRGDRRQALVVGGSILLSVLCGMIQAVLVFWGILHWPLIASLFFLIVVVAMGCEMSRDLLHNTQLSEELRESEERMTQAAAAANLGVWMRDLTRDKIWASENWRVLFGFSESERLDLDRILQRLHPDDREPARQMFAKAVARDGHYEMDFRVVLPDGQLRWIAARGSVEFNAAGKPILLRGISVDITRRKKAERELQLQREELARLSRMTMLGELSGSLAHELNQPLGAILRNAEAAELFLQEPSPDLEELRAILADIRRDDQRAGEVINRMRSLVRRHEVERSLLDPNLLVADVIKLVRSDADSRKVRLVFKPVSSLPRVRGDRVQLQQVILNLLLNAMDAAGDSAPEDRRVLVRIELADTQVEVAVSDAGHGIPPDRLARVFEPFFTTKPNGMGMGLPISRRIVEAHGGRIWAENNPGGGTAFHFTVPADGAEPGAGETK